MTDQLRDDLIGLQVDVIRYEEDAKQRTRERIKALVEALIAVLAIYNPTLVMTVYARDTRLEKLLSTASAEIKRTYAELNRMVAAEVGAVSVLVSQYVSSSIADAAVDGPSGDALTSPVEKTEFSFDIGQALIFGATAKAWWSRLAGDLLWKISNSLRQAVEAGAGLQQIIDGLNAIGDVAGGNAESIVRATASKAFADAVSGAYRSEPHIVTGIMQISVMDNKTTLTCRRYNGAEWDLQGNPINGNELPYLGGVPRHWGCRSIEIPIIFEDPANDIDYENWFASQTQERQEEILGAGRYRMWADGRMSFTDLVNMRSSPMTFSEFKKKYRKK